MQNQAIQFDQTSGALPPFLVPGIALSLRLLVGVDGQAADIGKGVGGLPILLNTEQLF